MGPTLERRQGSVILVLNPDSTDMASFDDTSDNLAEVFSELVRLQLRMADQGHLNEAELKSLTAQLPDGWDVDTALEEMKHFDSEQSEEADISTGNEVLLHLKMVSGGFLDDTELDAIFPKLPTNWTAEAALAAFENQTSGDQYRQLCLDLGVAVQPLLEENAVFANSESQQPSSVSQLMAASAHPVWQPDENMRSMILMAKSGYLDDDELMDLESQLPDGWTVDDAIEHAAKPRPKPPSGPPPSKSHDIMLPPPQQRGAVAVASGGLSPQDLVMQLRMVAAGFLDESELGEAVHALPTGWTVQRALDALDGADSTAEAAFLAALDAGAILGDAPAKARPLPASTGRSPASQPTEAQSTTSTARSSGQWGDAAASAEGGVNGAPPAEPRRGSLQSMLAFFSSRRKSKSSSKSVVR